MNAVPFLKIRKPYYEDRYVILPLWENIYWNVDLMDFWHGFSSNKLVILHEYTS